MVREIASWIDAERAGAFCGRYALLVFSLSAVGLFTAGISLWCLLDRLESRVRHSALRYGQQGPCSPILSTFRDRFLGPFTHLVDCRSPVDHLVPFFTISLVSLTVTGAGFLILALEIGQQDWLVQFDHALSASLHEHSPVNAVWIFQLVSGFGDPSTLASISLLFLIAMAVAGQWRLFFLWTITLPGAGILNQVLKNALQRPRPQLPNPWIAESGWSFPSGHAMCSVVIFGLLAYSICFLPTSRAVRLVFGLSMILLVTAIGFSRLYLGAHYFSDVIAGYFAAIFWLVICTAGDQAVRGRQKASALLEETKGISALPND